MPRQMRETFSPVDPRLTYSIEKLISFQGGIGVKDYYRHPRTRNFSVIFFPNATLSDFSWTGFERDLMGLKFTAVCLLVISLAWSQGERGTLNGNGC